MNDLGHNEPSRSTGTGSPGNAAPSGRSSGFQTVDPSTGQPGTAYHGHSQHEAHAILASARAAFEGWRLTRFEERAMPMRAAADVLRSRRDEFAALMTREMGKPIDAGRAVIVEQQPHPHAPVRRAPQGVEEKRPREVRFPDIILDIEAALGRIGQDHARGKGVVALDQRVHPAEPRMGFEERRDPAAKTRVVRATQRPGYAAPFQGWEPGQPTPRHDRGGHARPGERREPPPLHARCPGREPPHRRLR